MSGAPTVSAGASRVLVSLWDVNDLATPALMKSFYTRLAAGRSVAGALREAKISMIRSDRPARCTVAACVGRLRAESWLRRLPRAPHDQPED
jgi:CHAT domain-containing protein